MIIKRLEILDRMNLLYSMMLPTHFYLVDYKLLKLNNENIKVFPLVWYIHNCYYRHYWDMIEMRHHIKKIKDNLYNTMTMERYYIIMESCNQI